MLDAVLDEYDSFLKEVETRRIGEGTQKIKGKQYNKKYIYSPLLDSHSPKSKEKKNK